MIENDTLRQESTEAHAEVVSRSARSTPAVTRQRVVTRTGAWTSRVWPSGRHGGECNFISDTIAGYYSMSRKAVSGTSPLGFDPPKPLSAKGQVFDNNYDTCREEFDKSPPVEVLDLVYSCAAATEIRDVSVVPYATDYSTTFADNRETVVIEESDTHE